MVASPKLSSRKEPSKKKTATNPAQESMKKQSVISFRRVPHALTEKDLTAFFGQFGKIRQLRLSRSKRTGNSRGFGFIRFDLPEVAKIAVEATNNYFIGGKPIKTELLNPEAVHKGLFIGAPAGNLALRRSSLVRKAHNKGKHGTMDAEKIKKDAARTAKLAAMGIDYSIERRVFEPVVKAQEQSS